MSIGDTIRTEILGQKVTAKIKSITDKCGVSVLRLETEDGTTFSTNADSCTPVKHGECCLITNGRCAYEIDGECTSICGGNRPYGSPLCEIEDLKFKNEEEFEITKAGLEEFLMTLHRRMQKGK